MRQKKGFSKSHHVVNELCSYKSWMGLELRSLEGDERMGEQMRSVHPAGYYSASKRKEILPPPATTGMNLDRITPVK